MEKTKIDFATSLVIWLKNYETMKQLYFIKGYNFCKKQMRKKYDMVNIDKMCDDTEAEYAKRNTIQ